MTVKDMHACTDSQQYKRLRRRYLAKTHGKCAFCGMHSGRYVAPRRRTC